MSEISHRRRRRGFGLWMLLGMAFSAVVLGIALTVLSGREVTMPGWLTSKIEARLSAAMAGGSVDIGAAGFGLGPDWSPLVMLHRISVSDATDLEIAVLERIVVRFSAEHLFSGNLRATRMEMRGAALSLRREPDGRFDLAFETGAGPLGSSGRFADILDSVETIFDAPVLSHVQTIRAEDMTFQYEDVRAAGYWEATGAEAVLTRGNDEIGMYLRFSLLHGAGIPADVELTINSSRRDSGAALAVRVSGMPASDFSTQAPALAWLSVIDAPATVALRTEIDDTGVLSAMNGALEMGRGFLRPGAGTRPVAFQSGRAYFGYDPARQRITFDELAVVTDAMSLRAEGHAYLRDMRNGLPQSLLGQFRFAGIDITPDAGFGQPVSFDGGALDFRLRLAPFEVTLGQLVLLDGDAQILARGQVSAEQDEWRAVLDADVDEITVEKLRALWPARLASRTREWIVENVIASRIHDVSVNLRATPGAEPVMALSFRFSGAVVRYLKTLPVVADGIGYASITGKRFSLAVEQGQVVAPNGGILDAAGTAILIPDITREAARMDVALRVRGDIPAALSLLDEPPFEIMTRAGRPVDMADGQAIVSADIGLDLIRRLKVEDVNYRISATLQDVASDRVVEGKTLRADQLSLQASPEGVEISGSARVGQVPVRASWVQKFGPEGKGQSRVKADVELSQGFVDEFGIGLPDGSVSGAATAGIEVDLNRDEAPRFRLESDLSGLSLNLPVAGWRKAAGQTASLLLEGRLGRSAAIDALRFEGPGLEAKGSVALNGDGSLDKLIFERVRIGDWLDAPVVLTGRGGGRPPSVLIPGGRLDMRGDGLRQAGGNGGNGSGGGNGIGPITVALDELIVSPALRLADLRGDFTRAGGGLRGQFSASLNGQAPITGELVPQSAGTAIRVQSDDAGAVMRAIGMLERASGGTLNLVLVPRQQGGVYDGEANITDRLMVHGAPALADLLGAISVIGLLEQFSGDGLVFHSTEARFRLTPDQVVVSRSSAVGPSLGVSLNGYYNLHDGLLDMQGVISPIYLVNGIGALFTRRGEGLFGFNFRLAGAASKPQVQVNPLSILTPGAFREIFRRPSPELTE